jgi:hypothetical protein
MRATRGAGRLPFPFPPFIEIVRLSEPFAARGSHKHHPKLTPNPEKVTASPRKATMNPAGYGAGGPQLSHASAATTLETHLLVPSTLTCCT